MKSSDIAKKKKKFCTLVPINYTEINETLKKANVRQRKVINCTLAENLFHHKIRCLPSSDHRSHFSLELAVVRKLLKAQCVWLRSHGGTEVGLHTHDSASNCCTSEMGFQYPPRTHMLP